MYDLAPSILITDDDRAFRETLQSVFDARGFNTFLAADGEEAVRIVQNERIHLVFLDLHMPRLTGLEAMREVKRFNAQLPCILVSGGLDDRLRREASHDAFSVLDKPVRLDVVTRIVADAFRQTYDWPLG